MDLKYILCEPVSKLTVKANEQAALIQSQSLNDKQPYILEWTPSQSYQSVITNQPEWNSNNNQAPIVMSSPKSICSSISTCSSTSSNSSNDEYVTSPAFRSNSFSTVMTQPPSQSVQQQCRRRTASDVSQTRHHMFIYSHPNRRQRSESASSSSNSVQTRTPWTPYEDHLLQQGYDQGLSWAMISSTYLPHRSRGCCWGRFKTLQNKNMIDPNHSQLRHFRRPWRAVDFGSNNDSISK
ncbi:hypothetical protein BDF20DRAFT_76360 [Mycotypha africana]|uniref:uncharacterized protein n=1 Tax=Mycotypha africana TaxID=64632 RepID=UPI002301F808|nr:uncharacterized protein BDF20DRAFT_76360 [Mycotypha africana]KAI8991923.1 hypothetical protein BDF20DRAFT_76360 [Mycotypha africana]